jgi:hypothetical protein
MVARLVEYHVAPDGLDSLRDEIIERARVPWPAQPGGRKAEFFLVNTASGSTLSVLIGRDLTVKSAIHPARPRRNGGVYDVGFLYLGGPKESGVVDWLGARIAWYELFPSHARIPPASTRSERAVRHVWMAALLVARDGKGAVAVTVADDADGLENSPATIPATAGRVEDYDEVTYHFLAYGPC